MTAVVRHGSDIWGCVRTLTDRVFGPCANRLHFDFEIGSLDVPGFHYFTPMSETMCVRINQTPFVLLNWGQKCLGLLFKRGITIAPVN